MPVEADGSAYFRAPAGMPLAFQALDERGQAVQMMRSLTYLQPGETAACVGCHEPRTTAPPPQRRCAQALAREPSAIEPGPDGSQPLQLPAPGPAGARQAVRAVPQPGQAGRGSGPDRRAAGALHRVVQRAGPARALFRLGPAGRFPPGQQRAADRARPLRRERSPLMKLLRDGHDDVKLAAEDSSG